MVLDGTTQATPTPGMTPTHSPTTRQPGTAPTGDLQTVRLIPAALGPGSHSDLEPYFAKVLSVSIRLGQCQRASYVKDVAMLTLLNNKKIYTRPAYSLSHSFC